MWAEGDWDHQHGLQQRCSGSASRSFTARQPSHHIHILQNSREYVTFVYSVDWCVRDRYGYWWWKWGKKGCFMPCSHQTQPKHLCIVITCFACDDHGLIKWTELWCSGYQIPVTLLAIPIYCIACLALTFHIIMLCNKKIAFGVNAALVLMRQSFPFGCPLMWHHFSSLQCIN